MPATSYRRYPTGLKLEYAAGTLNGQTVKAIPRSTRQGWKSIDITRFWTGDIYTMDTGNLLLLQTLNENKRLRQLLRLAACLILIYKNILASFSLERKNIAAIQGQFSSFLSKALSILPGNKLWKWMPFSGKQWSAWTSRRMCKASALQLCRRQHPMQLAAAEQQVIREGCRDSRYRQWPLSGIYYELMRADKLHCSISTFYKYCRLLNITRKPERKTRKYTPLTADGPLKMLHMDITLYKTRDGVKHYIYVIRDNFSRAILACHAALEYSSRIAKETLYGVLVEHKLLDAAGSLITDGGAENKGEVSSFLGKAGMLWKQLIAQVDIVQSNSMVEAVNKIIKHRYLYVLDAANTEELKEQLEVLKGDFNAIPQRYLYGYTPNEVLAGAKPDKHRYSTRIAEAKADRVLANQHAVCKDTC